MELRKVTETAKNADDRELRKFGLLFAGILLGFLYFLIPWWKGHAGSSKVLAAGLICSGLAVAWPRALRWPFVAASLLGAGLGALNQRLLLTAVFFLVLVPMAVIRRWVSRVDPMGRAFEKNRPSYKIPCVGRDLRTNKERAF